jgi:hypothetical protein
MKSLFLAFALLFTVTACSAEKPAEPAKKSTAVAAVTAEKAPGAAVASDIKEEPKTKRVCKDVVKDGKPVKNKDGSVKQECRTVKIHKKHEGTKVPTK